MRRRANRVTVRGVRATGRVIDLCDAMDRIAPRWAAAEWDNTGLLVGDADWPLRRVLLTIDLTTAVLDEARRSRVQAIVSYHPPVFKPTKSLRVDRSSQTGIACEALAERIAVYSPHTALDAAPGGTNDALAATCGLEETQPLSVVERLESLGQYKLVVFVPTSALDRVAQALFSAGCGQIGGYERCSFRMPGQGTFFGTESTNPRLGQRGRLETVEEIRLEVVCCKPDLPRAIQAMRAAHPYETPAFDVYPLSPLAWEGVGPGRVGLLTRPVRLSDLARSLQRRTAAECVSVIGEPRQRVRRGLVCVGAAGSLPFEAACGCGPGDVVITGEIRHHDALEYQRSGAAAIALGHWASERPVLRPLAARLTRELRTVGFEISRADRDPFTAI